MAIDYSDWAATGDEDASFDKAPFDYDAGRKKLLARIARTMQQLNNERVAPAGGKDFDTLHNGGVHYKPTLNGHPIQLPGLPKDGVRISRLSLQNKLTGFSRDVEAGHFDSQIEAILSQSVSKAAGATTGGSRNISPEGRIKIAMGNQYNAKLSDDALEAKLIAAGHDAKLVKTALAERTKK